MTLKETLITAIEEKKGMNISVCDFVGRGYIVDYYIIAEASNVRQVGAIVDQIEASLKLSGYPKYRVEGGKESRWVLVDCGEIVVHVFLSEERQIYQIERLWADACTNI